MKPGFGPWGMQSMTLATILQRFRKKPMLPFASDENMLRIAPLAEEFFVNVLYDEEPLFVSDEATVWDVSLGPDVDELRRRCLEFYGVDLRPHDFKRSLWSLIEHLDRSRTKHTSS